MTKNMPLVKTGSEKILMERLKPFIYRKSARQRIIIYLISQDYSFDDLANMTVSDLKKIKLPEENDLFQSQNQLLSTLSDNASLFTYPGGRKMCQSDFFRILTTACTNVLGKSITVDEFKIYLNNNT